MSLDLFKVDLKSITDKPLTVSGPPFSGGVGQLSVSNFEKGGIKKMSALGDLIVPVMDICQGAYYVSCQKKNLKIKYGSKGSISNVDLGLI